MHAIRIGERERAWRVGIVSGLRRQMSGRGPERQDVERVLLQRSPADEGQPPPWLEAAANVDERRRGVGEEHHAEPREGGIERGWFEREQLGIGLDESHPFASFGGTFGERQNRRRDIDTHDHAVWRDGLGKAQRRVTAATADIQDALAWAWRQRRQGVPAQRSKL